MTRAAGAFAVFWLPGLLFSLLLALGERDWFHCFAHAETPAPPPRPSLFATGEFTPLLLETFTPPFSSPALFALHFGPAALFALFLLRARTTGQRRNLLALLAAFLLWALWLLLPPSAQRDCDATGPDAVNSLSLLCATGALAALLANKLNCLAGACR